MCANIDEYTHMHVKIYISVKMYKWDYKLQWTKQCGADDRKESTKLSKQEMNMSSTTTATVLGGLPSILLMLQPVMNDRKNTSSCQNKWNALTERALFFQLWSICLSHKNQNKKQEALIYILCIISHHWSLMSIMEAFIFSQQQLPWS